jgi:hypothetical protein
MFEIGIFCVIFLAVAYWAVLWLMGRRGDVLHGEFVKSEPHAEKPVRPIFPKRQQVRTAMSALVRSSRHSGRNGWSRC